MTSKILDSKKNKSLQPATDLWSLYKPEEAVHRFQSETIHDAKRWQKKTRAKLMALLKCSLEKPLTTKVRQIEKIDKGDYVREKILLQINENSVMPVYILIPKELKCDGATVIAFNGHGYGVKDIVGLWEDGKERDVPDGYQRDFAVQLCKKGFIVAAPEISCFGERQTDFSYLGKNNPAVTTCAHTSFLASHLGKSIVGIRVNDGMRLLDYLETRPEVNIKRVGAMGISGGGLHTMFSTCLDSRIKACVISGYFSTFKDSILAMGHCPCNYVHGIADFGEMYDLVGLIAPRPMLIESGSHDSVFPINAVKSSVSKAKKIYELFEKKNYIDSDYFSGRHRINGEKSYPFLEKHLKPN